MNNIISYYTKYREHIDEYNTWNKQGAKNQSASNIVLSQNKEQLKQKAKAIAEPLLLLDSYEHEKAEDSETFFQTLNIELMSLTGAIVSLPIAITKSIPVFNKFKDKSNIANKISNVLTRYKNASVNILGKNIALSKGLTIISSIAGTLFFISGIKKSMESQLGLIRKASYDATQQIINDPKMFTIPTKEQEEKINSVINYHNDNKTAIVDKLKEKMDIRGSFKSVKEYKENKKEYEKNKSEYTNSLKNETANLLTELEEKESKENKILYENYLKNVEHDVLEPLKKVETISNISYSALFTGGFLEYLITDKLVDVLKIKNTPIRTAVKFGVPLLTYLILNKNISNIENKAILATKYKHLKNFVENPDSYNEPKEEKNENIFKFIKNIYKDIKEYQKFSKTELPKLKEKTLAKNKIEYTQQQIKQAEILQRNTSMVINNQREEVYNQSVGIKALSETILGPIDILATAVGGFLGSKFATKCGNPKLKKLFAGIGAIITFIPAVIIEASLTKQQKLSEKIAIMLSLKSIQDPKIFSVKSKNKEIYQEKNHPAIFGSFIES